MTEHGRTLADTLVVEHLSRQRDAGNRSLQLMRHIIDEVVFNLRVTLLPEDDHDGEDKGDEQYHSEDHGWNHETHTREDV